MATIFTKIINRDIPCYFIGETDNFFAFLDINPVAVGHTLVVPKHEVDYFFDIDDELYAEYMQFTKRIAKSIEKVVDCVRVGVTILGLEVPHAHVHLVPLDERGIIDFKNKVDTSKINMEQLAKEINQMLVNI